MLIGLAVYLHAPQTAKLGVPNFARVVPPAARVFSVASGTATRRGDHGMPRETEMAAGWMVTVGVVKNDKLRYVAYAVAMADQAEAVKASLAANAGEATIDKSELREADLKGLGLKAGELVAIYDDRSDPRMSRTWRPRGRS